MHEGQVTLSQLIQPMGFTGCFQFFSVENTRNNFLSPLPPESDVSLQNVSGSWRISSLSHDTRGRRPAVVLNFLLKNIPNLRTRRRGDLWGSKGAYLSNPTPEPFF